MSYKKNTIIVILCLIPTAAIITFVVLGNDCLKKSEAQVIFDQAIKLEENGNLKAARLKYKIIDGRACTNYKLRGEAFNKAVIIQEKLKKL